MAAADPPPVIKVEGQPLAANVQRVAQALEFLGAPMSEDIRAAVASRDARKLQELLDPQVLCVVDINPESRVKAARGPAKAVLQQAGYTPVLVKVINRAASIAPLRMASRQAGPPYAGVQKSTMVRERQTHLQENENTRGEHRLRELVSQRFMDRLFATPQNSFRLEMPNKQSEFERA